MRHDGRPRRRDPRDAERGAALVEFALVLPLLALFLFGIIDFGLAMNDYQSVRQGAREGARQAVVNDWAGSAVGCSSGTPDQQLVCLTKSRTGVSGTAVRIVVTDGGAVDAGYRDDVVEVCVAAPLSSTTKFLSPFLDGRFLSTSIAMRAETQLDLAPGVYGDAAPPGTTWSSLCD